MTPTIAIASCRSLADYVESVRRAGGDPRPLAPEADRPGDVLSWCSGILFTGGGDVDPSRYGAQPHPAVVGLDQERDEYELELARLAIEHDVPILAICRGLQVLNVAGGGSLIQDIPTQVVGAVEHSVKTPLSAIAHDVWVTRGSRLAALMADQTAGGDTLAVNSRHHQSVAGLAAGFQVTATAPDGVIEAFERQGARFCLAVQWHPENFWRTGEYRPLFEGFVGACQPVSAR